MYKPDDKDIDRLSRDAAEHYHAPGQPSWDALQQILDKELPREKEKKRRGFLFFFFLSVLLLAGFLFQDGFLDHLQVEEVLRLIVNDRLEEVPLELLRHFDRLFGPAYFANSLGGRFELERVADLEPLSGTERKK